VFAPPPLPRTLDASVRDVASTKAEVRVSALADLVRHGRTDDPTRDRVLPLVERALADDIAQVRAAAAVALGELGSGCALPRLLVAIDDPHPHVRQMAINALGEIGDARAAQRIARALSDERPEVRYQAVIAYPRLEEDGAVVDAALVAATEDADPSVRYIALRVAEERGSLSPALLAAARAHLGASEVAGEVVLAAAILLAKSDSASPDPALVAVLVAASRGDKIRGRLAEPEDTAEAIELAGRLGLREVVPALERRAFGFGRHLRETSAFAATIALARLGNARAVESIVGDLAHRDPHKRRAAIVAAGRARLEQTRGRIAGVAEKDDDPVTRELAGEALRALEAS
jgi:HEAT repeat protein